MVARLDDAPPRDARRCENAANGLGECGAAGYARDGSSRLRPGWRGGTLAGAAGRVALTRGPPGWRSPVAPPTAPGRSAPPPSVRSPGSTERRSSSPRRAPCWSSRIGARCPRHVQLAVGAADIDLGAVPVPVIALGDADAEVREHLFGGP